MVIESKSVIATNVSMREHLKMYYNRYIDSSKNCAFQCTRGVKIRQKKKKTERKEEKDGSSLKN